MGSQRILTELRNNEITDMSKAGAIILTDTLKPQLNITLTNINLRKVIVIKRNGQVLIIISNCTEPSIARIQTILSNQTLSPIGAATKKGVVNLLTHQDNQK